MMPTNEWNWEEVAGGPDIAAQGYPCAMALDRNDAPQIAFSNTCFRPPNDYVLGRKLDSTWSFRTLLPRPGIEGAAVSLAIDSKNHSHLAYIVNRSGDRSEIWYENDDGTEVVERVSIPAKRAFAVCVLVDSNDNPRIVFGDGFPDTELWQCWRSSSANGQWTASKLVSSTDWQVGYLSAAFDADDRLHLACYDKERHALRYGVSHTADWHFEIVETSAPQDAGLHPSLAIDSFGMPVICHGMNSFDTTAKLRIARFDGHHWKCETIAAMLRGTACSLALDSHDRPLVVYRSHANQELMLAFCDATGKWNEAVIFRDMGDPTAPSLQIDRADRPHVAVARYYFDHDYDMRLWYGRRTMPVIR